MVFRTSSPAWLLKSDLIKPDLIENGHFFGRNGIV